MLRAVWHGLRGDWEAAHELAQAQDDAEGAWVHAWLHRIEGDLGNANYWYRCAQRFRRAPLQSSDSRGAVRPPSLMKRNATVIGAPGAEFRDLGNLARSGR
jgi:hypothetical protein